MNTRTLAVSLGCTFTLAALANACANGAPNDAAAYSDDITTTSATEPKDAGAKKKGSTGTSVGTDTTTDGTDDTAATDDTGSTTDSGTSVPTKDAGATVTDSGVAPTCAKTAPSNVCGVSPQCGCATNETCDVTNMTTGASACVKAGSGAAGASCTSSSGCLPGLTCASGVCHAYCGAGGSCTGGASCLSYNNASGKAIPNYDVCSVSCDLMNPKAACGSNGCGNVSGSITNCQKAGTGLSDDSCNSAADCSPGMLCIDDGYDTVCEKWCRIGKGDCPLGFSCTALASPPVIGGVTYGFCY